MYKVLAILIALCAMPFSLLSKPLTGQQCDSIDIYKAPFVPQKLKSTGQFIASQDIMSPDNSIRLTVTTNDGSINYSILKNSAEVIASSQLDLQLSDGMLVRGVNVDSVKNKSLNETLSLPYGERTSVKNRYNQITLYFTNSNNVRFSLVFRVYNEGVGFKYIFPNNNSIANIKVSNELTQFNLADVYTVYKETYNENGYTPSGIHGLRSLIPLTLIGNNLSLCINEAGNDQFARTAVRGSGKTLQTYFVGTTSQHALPVELPWRYIVIAETTNLLVENKEMLYALNAQAYNNAEWDWVKPGKVFRCLNLSTAAALESIDFCVDMNIDYMMFDAGWYGLGYGQSKEKDPASNPLKVIDGLDMQAVRAYANQKNIGVILYVNYVAWNNYDNQKMFDLYESWGIKGLKLGFVDGYSANGNIKVYGIIREAARRKMLINVHDNFRPTGLVQKHTNLMTAEGVRGNEHTSNKGDHNVLIPYTRMLTGATDFTICYFGNDPNYNKPSFLATTRAHQLAMSVMMYSPLQHVLWYAKPGIYHVPDEVELFTVLPVAWDDFKLVAGDMGKYVSMARRKGDDWYLSTMNNSAARDLWLPLDFLESNLDYRVVIYKDADPKTINKVETTLEQLKQEGAVLNNELHVSLESNGGEVIVFRERNDATATGPDVNVGPKLKLYPNPASDMLNIELEAFESPTVRIWSLSGKKVYERKFQSLPANHKIDVSKLEKGVYILVVETTDLKLSELISID